MRRIVGVFLIILFSAILGRADVVVLKNGDRLTGSLVNISGGNLEFKSEAAGNIAIPLAKIQSLSIEKPVAVVVKGKPAVEGQLQLEPSGNWQVTQKGRSQTIIASIVETIMPEQTYHGLVEHQAEPWQDWKGSTSLGYSIQRGDQQTSTISSAVAAVRERPEAPIFIRHWRSNYGLTMLFSKAQENGSLVQSNTISTNLREDYLLSPRDFVFGVGQLDHVQAQGLYLRQTVGGGFGHDLIHNSRTIFSLLGGLTYVHEKFYDGQSDQTAQALAGEKLGIQLTKWMRLDHYLNFYPNLTNTGQYRFDTASTLAIRLSNHLSLNTGVVDLFLSYPTPGNKKNNLAFTTGIGYNF
jgi:putative salt-induced outer membrane protein YdiY